MINYENLKNKYGTPLYLYDVNLIENIIMQYKNNFKSNMFDTEILYASKAFSIKEMIRIIKNSMMSLDVVSMGELLTAKAVSFPFDKIYFHGNNKSEAELSYAIENGIGTIVVDNFMELELLNAICLKKNKKIKILIRLNVGVEAHTHKFIVTANIDSKFGVLFNSKEYLEMINYINNNYNLKLEGFHSHIGSQIFDLEAYDAAISKLFEVAETFSYPLTINLGGGFGVKYTDADKPIPYNIVAKHLIELVETKIKETNVSIAKLCIEPGRSIVAEAGQTLYTIGYIKQTPNKLYYFVDGGMTDNIRPALYQAVYSCDIVGKENVFKNKIVTIAGKCCESGDIIIENTVLPEATRGDLLVTYSTGAYGYSMSSNYNKNLTPGVVFIKDNKEKLVVRRQTYEELLEREI